MLRFTISEAGFDETWADELRHDIEKETIRIDKNIQPALKVIGSEMALNLLSHLQKDWYDAWQPVNYQRRAMTNPKESIMSTDNISIETTRNSLIFDYSPKGNDSEKWEYPEGRVVKNGDELINIIQYNRGWDKPEPSIGRGGATIGERPFWNNFVSEQEDGRIMENLAFGLHPYKIETNDADSFISLEESYL